MKPAEAGKASAGFLMDSLFFLHQSRVDIILVQAHLYLHGRGIVGDLQLSEVIEKEQHPKPDPKGIGNLQDGKSIGNLSCDLGIDLGKKSSHVHIVIEGHNGKCGTEKCGEAYTKHLRPPPKLPGDRLCFICDDK